jgi:hypothetical protein
MTALGYPLGQCLDGGILRKSLYNIRIAGIKVLRSPIWERAGVEAAITIIIIVTAKSKTIFYFKFSILILSYKLYR